MPTAEKAQKIDELTDMLRASKGSVLMDYRGLDVTEITRLRRELAAEEVQFHVAKNTLLEIAAGRAEIQVTPDLLVGPTAVAFGMRDEVSVARLLTDYVRRNRSVSIKGGIIGGRTMSAEQVGRVAELPPRPVLLAQLLGVVQAPLSRALGVVQAPAREVAGLAEALRNKQESTEPA
jgi:large subunit ribosomal protein L10